MNRTRRLAAVFFADIVGYTRLSSVDEDAALAVVDELQRIANESVEGRGRVVKFLGDGVLAAFDSATGALESAIELRQAFTESGIVQMHECSVSIGMHLGEVVETADGDVYGDGVNTAARIEGVAGPGGIVFSEDVYRTIRNRDAFDPRPFGSHSLKGLEHPLELYTLSFETDGSSAASPVADSETTVPAAALYGSEGAALVPARCPACLADVAVSVFEANARFRCPNCGCPESLPNEAELLARAIVKGLVGRDILAHLASADLPLTLALLDGSLETSVTCPLLAEADVLARPELEELEVEAWLGNAVSRARLAGSLPGMRRQMARFPEGTAELEERHIKAAEAFIDIAHDNFAAAEGQPPAEREEPYHFGRILLANCGADADIGETLLRHLSLLEQGDVVARVGHCLVAEGDGQWDLLDERMQAYHAVVLLLSPALMSSDIGRSGGVAELLERHERREIVLIPVIGRAMAWQALPLAALSVLPEDGVALASASSVDDACARTVMAVQRVMEAIPPEVIVGLAERGDTDAINNLWMAFLTGGGLPKNHEKALAWASVAAQHDQTPGMSFTLATMLEKWDPEAALHHMSAAAEGGHSWSMVMLAQWFDEGICVEASPELAFKWLLAAAEAGEDDALVPLGSRYLEGIGTAVDEHAGNEWLRRAVAKGHAVGMVALGDSYANGRGLPQDPDKAHELWQKAADTGDARAREILVERGLLETN